MTGPRRATRAALAAAAGLLATASAAQDVVAVLGADLRPYHEAYERFQEKLGRPVPVLPAGAAIPGSVKVVVAFGGKAAVQSYPERVALVYGVAPGLEVGPETHDGVTVQIPMQPAASVLLENLRAVQPKLKRLAVLWASDAFEADVAELGKAGEAAGIEIVSERVDGAGALPSALRRLGGRADAVWLTADPLLINAENFETVRQFSRANAIPFYAPTEGLAEHGAVASVSVSYADIGRAAAAVVARLLAGETPPAKVRVGGASLAVNLAAAKDIGVAVPDETVRRAAKVFP